MGILQLAILKVWLQMLHVMSLRLSILQYHVLLGIPAVLGSWGNWGIPGLLLCSFPLVLCVSIFFI